MGELVFDSARYDKWIRAQRAPNTDHQVERDNLSLGENWFIVEPRAVPECGTEAGYVRHLKQEEMVDAACAAAGTRARRARHARREEKRKNV